MLHFRELQRFRQPWLWAILAGAFGLSASRALLKPAVRDPKTLLLSVALPVLVMIWLAFIALVTEVYDDEVKLQFVGMWFPKHIPIRDIARLEAVTYRPILDYGGWGIRMGSSGWAYNVSGNRGVRIHFKDGRQFLIGSQRPDELAGAIAARRPLLQSTA